MPSGAGGMIFLGKLFDHIFQSMVLEAFNQKGARTLCVMWREALSC